MATTMRQTARQYFDLTKPRVVALIVFTALVGMCLAIDGLPTVDETRRGGKSEQDAGSKRPPRMRNCELVKSTQGRSAHAMTAG